MDILLYLIGIALTLGMAWFIGFLWALRTGQLDDMDMAAHRALELGDIDTADETDKTAPPPAP
jgi:cbb3-type cytochrome oxidase maturation protein